MKDVMERAPLVKELIDMYIGPGVVAAKQQEEELEKGCHTCRKHTQFCKAV